MVKYRFASSSKNPPESIDLIENDDLQIRFDRINLNDVTDTIDLSADDDECIRELTPGEVGRLQAKPQSSTTPLAVPPGYRKQNSATTPTGVTIRPEADAELEDGDFIRVKQIVKHHFTGEVLARSILLRRTRRVNKYFKRDRNELCVAIQLPDETEHDLNPSLDSSLVDIPLTSIIQLRTILFTNMVFPHISFRHNGRFYRDDAEIEEQAELVVRWKYVEYYSLKDRRVKSGAIMHLMEDEVDLQNRTSDVAKYLKWREQDSAHKPRASKVAKISSLTPYPIKSEPPTDELVDLTMDEPESSRASKRKFDAIYVPSDSEEEITEGQQETIFREIKKRRNRHGVLTERSESVSTTTTTHKVRKSKTISGSSSFTSRRQDSLSPLVEDVYTFADICAGAGGMSRGAEQAGLKHSFLLDNWADACRTLRLNFPGARVLETDIHEFCTSGQSAPWMRVDVLHISFPCQTYSAAHTRPVGACPNDDANEAAGYCVEDILKLTRPRVVTFEQTEGLFSRHPDSFAALIQQLTAMNYNVRWRVLQCDRFGNVQPRKRLFVIASCPGAPLPPFPKPTHGNGHGLQKPVTIRDRLNLVRPGMDSHDQHMRRFGKRNGVAYNPNQPLRQCITTGGGDGDLHPDGDRSFTMRELACLAGFPAYHKFAHSKAMTTIRKQIGNAVPSMVGNVIFGEIIQSMREHDKVVAAWKPEYIELD
ncbi:hypothetical protein DOTSEDRAFT_48843 [Dothistroma septosporum NZE10]|uniref:DNA (cytosine-5-)-methyltransferase n=1 Tax=Dothistroma septosporum (strain NZE10 / CBS 128990) TaxID=675120 RepID=N1Q1G4_DOTSN|nr:hypothetical protein DOTSEDRAFT_48843 [Dothistroma septosporum NZE10]